MEKLGRIQTIDNVIPIIGADNIEKITFVENGWECIAKKGEFKKGQLCVYVQIDTICPETEVFEFLRKRNFRVSTMKLNKFGVISQGLALPLSAFIWPSTFKAKPETDVTEMIGLTKYSKSVAVNYAEEKQPKVWYKKWVWLFKQKLYKLFPNLKPVNTKPFPTHLVSKTDEDRIQNHKDYFTRYGDKIFSYSEKLDGSSITMIYDGKFRVCSRNLELIKKDDLYWDTAIKEDFEEKMKRMFTVFGGNTIVIQGELIGKPQGNSYKLSANEIRVFNLFVNGQLMNNSMLDSYSKRYGFKIPPQLGFASLGLYTLETLLKSADGKSELNPNTMREGLVFRMDEDPRVSFKAISNEWLVANNE